MLIRLKRKKTTEKRISVTFDASKNNFLSPRRNQRTVVASTRSFLAQETFSIPPFISQNTFVEGKVVALSGMHVDINLTLLLPPSVEYLYLFYARIYLFE